jgi:DNA-binding NtrC family response regulator
LIGHFLEEFCATRERPGVSEEAMASLMAYDYPGNIRELKAIIQAALNLSRGGSITVKTLPANVSGQKKQSVRRFQDEGLPLSLSVSLADMEKEHILRIFKENSGNLTHSARLLEISLNTLRRKLNDYGIDRK